MILYSVTITLEASIESDWVKWMKTVHIPDVLRAGCFSECHIYKAVASEGDEPVYVMQYSCRSLEEYHRYRDNFAPARQKDHTDRYAGRFHGARVVLEEIARLDSNAL